jgi:hypothetical protein
MDTFVRARRMQKLFRRRRIWIHLSVRRSSVRSWRVCHLQKRLQLVCLQRTSGKKILATVYDGIAAVADES